MEMVPNNVLITAQNNCELNSKHCSSNCLMETGLDSTNQDREIREETDDGKTIKFIKNSAQKNSKKMY